MGIESLRQSPTSKNQQKTCCLCSSSDVISRMSRVKKGEAMDIIKKDVLTEEFIKSLGKTKANTNVNVCESSVCGKCYQLLSQILGYKQQMQELQGKIDDIVHCFRTTFQISDLELNNDEILGNICYLFV